MLTCNPAREVPVTCLRGGYSASQGGGQISPGHWDILRVNCRHVFGNTVRYIFSVLNSVERYSKMRNLQQNSEFCFPLTSMFPSASPREKKRVSGKQNSALFPMGSVKSS